MKKLLLLATMLIASFTSYSQNIRELVYLKNGEIVKGNLIEFQPDRSLKLETVDGNSMILDYKDIEKISRESDQSSLKTYSLSKGYRGFVSFDAILGNFLGIRMSTTHGRQLNNKIFLGAGLGMCFASEWDMNKEHYSIPLYADFRVDFIDKKITPFLETKLGVDYAVEGCSGFYGDLSLGCRIKRCSISFGIDTINKVEHEYHFYNDGDETWFSYDTYGVRGLNLMSRFSFEF